MADIEVNGVPLNLSRPQDRVTLSELKAGAIRMRNFGADISTIAAKFGLSDHDAERVLNEGLRDVLADDAQAIRARQQATLNDIKRAMYPGMVAGDKDHANVLINVLKHESDIHAIKTPQRLQIGVDQETFTTRVEEDMRELGMSGDQSYIDVGTQEEDEPWSNT